MTVSKMLSFYAEHFSTTKINYSFRRIPASKPIAGWIATTPDKFWFTHNVSKKVTNFSKLKNCGPIMAYFHEVVLGL